MRLRCLLLCLLCWGLCAQASEIYKSRDKDGNIVFSDKPDSKSEQVVLPPINTVPANPGSHTTHHPRPRSQQEAPAYDLHIISPRDGVIISPEQRDLAIAVGLNQPLQEGQWLLYYMDGELLEESQSTSILVREVPRGARSFTVELVTAQGVPLARSQSVTANVMRPIARPNPSPSPR